MALKNRTDQKKYVRIKDGKLYIGKDLETPYDEIEGTVTNMYYKNEEYNGAPLRKLIVILSDDEDNYQLSINTESNSYSALVSFLRQVDLTKPVTLHPMEETVKKDGAPDVQKKTILVSQEGKFAKSYFTKDNTHGLPRWEQVTVGKKKVTDKSAYHEFLEQFVTDELIPQLSGAPITKTVVNKPADEEAQVEEDAFPWTK